MQIRTETDNGTLIAYVAGSVDGGNAFDFQRSMHAVVGDDSHTVVIDCASLSEVTSAGLSAFLMLARDLKGQRIRFALCCLAPKIRNVFEMTGFDKIIPVHASQANALDFIED